MSFDDILCIILEKSAKKWGLTKYLDFTYKLMKCAKVDSKCYKIHLFNNKMVHLAEIICDSINQVFN